MVVQSIIFKKAYYTLAQAKRWLHNHNYVGLEVDETPKTYRFRQIEPKHGKNVTYSVITLNPGINFTIMNVNKPQKK